MVTIPAHRPPKIPDNWIDVPEDQIRGPTKQGKYIRKIGMEGPNATLSNHALEAAMCPHQVAQVIHVQPIIVVLWCFTQPVREPQDSYLFKFPLLFSLAQVTLEPVNPFQHLLWAPCTETFGGLRQLKLGSGGLRDV
jgi:hypothetical protein